MMNGHQRSGAPQQQLVIDYIRSHGPCRARDIPGIHDATTKLSNAWQSGRIARQKDEASDCWKYAIVGTEGYAHNTKKRKRSRHSDAPVQKTAPLKDTERAELEELKERIRKDIMKLVQREQRLMTLYAMKELLSET